MHHNPHQVVLRYLSKVLTGRDVFRREQFQAHRPLQGVLMHYFFEQKYAKKALILFP